jgi:hypothetical protein
LKPSKALSDNFVMFRPAPLKKATIYFDRMPLKVIERVPEISKINQYLRLLEVSKWNSRTLD